MEVFDTKSYKEVLNDLMKGIVTNYCGYPTSYTAFDAIDIFNRKNDWECAIAKRMISIMVIAKTI